MYLFFITTEESIPRERQIKGMQNKDLLKKNKLKKVLLAKQKQYIIFSLFYILKNACNSLKKKAKIKIATKKIISTVILIHLFLIKEGKIIAKERLTPLRARP